MQRRAFTQAALTSTAALALPSAFGQATFKEGTDYLKLGRPVPVDAPAGEVLEFWLLVPHCASLEPTFHAWTKKTPAHGWCGATRWPFATTTYPNAVVFRHRGHGSPG